MQHVTIAIRSTVDASTGVALVQLERAPANGLNPDVLTEFDWLRSELETDSRVRAVVLTSAVDGMFCAGADAKWVAEGCRRRGAAAFVHDFRRFTAGFTSLSHSIQDGRLPWIAAINGHCVAGGLELALACDLRIAADEGVRFAFPELAMFGAPPTGGGALQQLVRAVGRSKALELVATGRTFDSRSALAWRLVDDLATPADLQQTALRIGERFAHQNVAAGMPALKRALNGATLPVDEARRLDREAFEERLDAPQFAAGLEAFAQRFGG